VNTTNEYKEYKARKHKKYRPCEYKEYRPCEYKEYRPREYKEYRPCEYNEYRPCEHKEYKPCEYKEYRPCEYKEYRPCEYNEYRPCEHKEYRPCEYKEYRPCGAFRADHPAAELREHSTLLGPASHPATRMTEYQLHRRKQTHSRCKGPTRDHGSAAWSWCSSAQCKCLYSTRRYCIHDSHLNTQHIEPQNNSIP